MPAISQIQLSKKQARLFLLKHHYLLPPRQLKGKDGIIQYIKKAGCIQFDPLDKVGRNPDLVLQSRLNNYDPEMLGNLLYQERKLLDGWDKNMSIYPVEDWPFFERYRQRARQRKYKTSQHLEKILPEVRKKIKEKGPVSSLDLKFDKKVDWAWAPTRAARAALESLYNRGDLIIYNKVGTRKLYDFANKHLPSKILSAPDPNKTEEGYYDWHIKRRIGGVGMLWALSGSDAWLGIRKLKKKRLVGSIERLLVKKELIKLKVKGIKHFLYIRKEEEKLLYEIINGYKKEPKAAFIAPLDNLMWDRKLIKNLFDFEYRWEVYKPVEERKYGYYVLPVLYGDRFIARFEPIYNREDGELLIKNWWWEDDVSLNNRLETALSNCLKEFASYLGAKSIKVGMEGKGMNWFKGII